MEVKIYLENVCGEKQIKWSILITIKLLNPHIL